MNKDSLGDRMKSQYEDRTRYSLPRRTYTILRVDGKAFHTLTRDMDRPFDKRLSNAMCDVTCSLTAIQGARFAYTQSDEVSVLLTDFDNIKTDAWFDGNIQKMVSVAASMATEAFMNSISLSAHFDARVFTIPDPTEVANYFIWRQQDAVRNSIQMVGRSYFSHKELEHKSCDEIQEMLWQEYKINWNDTPTRFKRGICNDGDNIDWEIPIFTQDRDYLNKLIPRLE